MSKTYILNDISNNRDDYFMKYLIVFIFICLFICLPYIYKWCSDNKLPF